MNLIMKTKVCHSVFCVIFIKTKTSDTQKCPVYNLHLNLLSNCHRPYSVIGRCRTILETVKKAKCPPKISFFLLPEIFPS